MDNKQSWEHTPIVIDVQDIGYQQSLEKGTDEATTAGFKVICLFPLHWGHKLNNGGWTTKPVRIRAAIFCDPPIIWVYNFVMSPIQCDRNFVIC